MEMSEEDAFKIMMRQREPENPYNINNFIGLDGIRAEFKHKQKIQIYSRPKVNKDGSMTLRPLDNMKLQQLLEDIKSIYITNGDFSQHVLDHDYAKQVHDETCDYDPYKD